MARAGGKYIFRRGRDNHRRSRHLHEDEVVEAWGEIRIRLDKLPDVSLLYAGNFSAVPIAKMP